MQVMLVWGLGFTLFFFSQPFTARAAAGGAGGGGVQLKHPLFISSPGSSNRRIPPEALGPGTKGSLQPHCLS